MNRYTAEGPWTRRYHLKRMRLVSGILRKTVKQGDNFSDVGCGTGEYIGIASQIGSITTGTDISRTYLRRACAFGGTDSRLVLSALGQGRLPFNDQSFDIVLCSEVLEHLEIMDQAIDELFRVSKKTVIISLPVRGVLRESFGKIRAIERKLDLVDKRVGHINIHALNKICKKLARKGWDIQPTTSWNYCEPMETLKLPLSLSPLINSIQSFLDFFFPNSGNAAIIACEKTNVGGKLR